jgi:two-component system, NarL family, invasion response regulator UvrY
MSDARESDSGVPSSTGVPGDISVLLVDDHAVVREGYRRLLERDPDITVVGEAGDAASAHAAFVTLKPRIVVMDVTMPGANGIEAMQHMLQSRPDARVLIFSMHAEAIFATRALQAGAFGYVTKASAPQVLVQAVREIARGTKYVSPEVAQKLALRRFNGGADNGLSARELDVLRLLAQGRTVRQIAESMGISPKTVANNQSAIKQKLEASTAIELLKKAGELGMS